MVRAGVIIMAVAGRRVSHTRHCGIFKAPSRALLSFLRGQLNDTPYVSHEDEDKKISGEHSGNLQDHGDNETIMTYVDSSKAYHEIKAMSVIPRTSIEKGKEMIEWTISSDDTHLLLRILAEMVRRGEGRIARERLWGFVKARVKLRLSFFNQFMGALLNARRHHHIWEVADMIKFSGLEPDKYTYVYMLQAALKEKNYILLSRLEKEMRKFGMIDSPLFFNMLINGYSQKGDLNKVSMIIQEMQTLKFPMRVDTLNTLLKGQAHLDGDPRYVEKVIERMWNSSLAPDTRTYNILLAAYVAAGEFDKVDSVLEFTEKQGICHDTATQNIRLNMYSKLGQLKRMEELYGEMLKGLSFFRADAVSVTTMIVAYHNRNMTHKALKVFNDSRQRDIVLNSVVFNAVLQIRLKKGKPIDAINTIQETLKEMSNLDIPPDSATYGIVFHNLGLIVPITYKGVLERYLLSISRVGFSDYNLDFLSKLAIKGKYKTAIRDAAQDLASFKKSAALEGSDAYYCLEIEMYMSQGRFKKAMEEYEKLVEMKAPIGERVYSALIRGALENNLLPLANRLVKEAEERKIDPVYVMLACLSKRNATFKTLNGWMEAFTHNLLHNELTNLSNVPKYNIKTFTQVAQYYFNRRNWLQAETIMKVMTEKYGLQMDMNAYIAIFHGYIKNRRFDEALKIMEEISIDPNVNSMRAFTDTRPFSNLLISRAGGTPDVRERVKRIRADWKDKLIKKGYKFGGDTAYCEMVYTRKIAQIFEELERDFSVKIT